MKVSNMSQKKKYIAITALIVIAAILFFVIRSNREAAVTYSEITVRKSTVGLTVVATGTVQPQNRLEIKPPIAGRIEQVMVTEGQKLKKGQLLAWMSSTERAALLDSARSQGAAELKRWEDLYRPTPIVAPISGTLILRSVEAGQTFTNADAILVMSDRLTIKAQVDETDLAQVKVGQSVNVDLDAYPGQTIAAKVDQIAYEAKTVNNVTNYVVDVLPEVTPDYMRSGMTANVSFRIERHENVLVVPTEALKASSQGPTVLVKGAKGEAVSRDVKIGISDGKQTEILAGLQENDTVLIARAAARKKGEAATSPFAPKRPTRAKGGPGGP